MSSDNPARAAYEAKTNALVGRRLTGVRYWDVHDFGDQPRTWDYDDWHHAVMGADMKTDRGPFCTLWTNSFHAYGIEVFETPMADHVVSGDFGPESRDVSSSLPALLDSPSAKKALPGRLSSRFLESALESAPMSAPANRTSIILVAIDERTAKWWDTIAADVERVDVHRGSILDISCDAVVSPANSFGFMDGGLDALYLDHFGPDIQLSVRERILYDHQGELLIGEAVCVPTGSGDIPWLIAAPTMRVPMALPKETVNPYLAMRAVLNVAAAVPEINTVAVPGLGTGVGRVSPAVCARQIRAALTAADAPARLPQSWAEASIDHQLLYTDRPTRLQY